MKRKHWSDQLVRAGACQDAIDFALKYKTFLAAWKACSRGTWLLWWLGRSLPDTKQHREQLTVIAIRIVLSIPNRKIIPVWDAWARNYLKNRNRSDNAAYYAADAADAATNAAYAAYDAAYAAYAADAADAADAAAYAAAYAANAANAAVIVRSVYKTPPRRRK